MKMSHQPEEDNEMSQVFSRTYDQSTIPTTVPTVVSTTSSSSSIVSSSTCSMVPGTDQYGMVPYHNTYLPYHQPAAAAAAGT
jgi:hypothetical protein